MRLCRIPDEMIGVGNYELYLDNKGLGEEENPNWFDGWNFDEAEKEFMRLKIKNLNVFFLKSVAVMGVVVDIERITLLDVINSEPDWQIKLLDINPAIKVRFMKEEKNDEITKIYISVPMIWGTFAKESMDFALTAYFN